MPPRVKYHALNDDEATYSEQPPALKRLRPLILHWLGHVICIITIGMLIKLDRYPSNPRGRAECWREFNFESPINEAVVTAPHVTTRFNGSLWYESPFKGPPSPIVEAAWKSVMDFGMIGVTASDVVSAGHNLNTSAKFPSEAGGGHIAVAVGTHQLHCLHYIWQDHHRQYFPEVAGKIKDIPEMYERHYEHCVDYIRQSLMCNFDTGLVTYDWVLDHQNPTPNSNAMHKCVDWDHVQGWLKDKVVSVPEGFEWRQPPGQVSLPWNP